MAALTFCVTLAAGAVLSGCGITAPGVRVSHSAGASAASSADPGSPSPAATAADSAPGSPPPAPGMLDGEQLRSLRGLTIEEARQRLKEFGHTGDVTVGTIGFVEGCGEERVCLVRPDKGTSLTGPIGLFLNKKLTIAPPP